MRIVFLGNFGVDYSSETHHKKSLESLGHEVIALQETVATSEQILNESMNSDMLVWVHTHNWQTPGNLGMDVVLQYLKKANIPSVAYHLDLWLGLRREQDLKRDPVYQYVEYFFTVDKLMSDWFNENTTVKGKYLPAAVFDKECYMVEVDERPDDVIFVGSKGYHPEWQYRPVLIDFLQANYQERFKRYGGDSPLGTTRGQALNEAYAKSKVAIGDSLCINFDYPYYWSDRVYETLGRGGFIIHPYIKGMEQHFTDGEHLVFYDFNDFPQLMEKIDYYIENEDEREKIRKAGHEHVKKNHTYKNRWEHIIKEIGL